MNEVLKPGFTPLIIGSTKYKMFNFMVSILLLLILSAVLEGTRYGYLVVNSMSSIVFILGTYALGAGNRRTLLILIILGLPWFLSEWTFTKSSRTIFSSLLFFLFVTITILDHILKIRRGDNRYAVRRSMRVPHARHIVGDDLRVTRIRLSGGCF